MQIEGKTLINRGAISFYLKFVHFSVLDTNPDVGRGAALVFLESFSKVVNEKTVQLITTIFKRQHGGKREDCSINNHL
jgi:hypothetical protein